MSKMKLQTKVMPNGRIATRAEGDTHWIVHNDKGWKLPKEAVKEFDVVEIKDPAVSTEAVIATSGIELASFTFIGTGSQSVTGLTALPKALLLWLSQKNATDNLIRWNFGATDGTISMIDSIFGDATSSKTVKSTSKPYSAYDRSGGTIQEQESATFTSFDNNGGGVFGFTFNIATNNISIQTRALAFS